MELVVGIEVAAHVQALASGRRATTGHPNLVRLVVLVVRW